VEIGAGVCWLSSVISQKKLVEKINAIDISSQKLELARQNFIPEYKGKRDKINIINSDFHQLPLRTETIDFAAIPGG